MSVDTHVLHSQACQSQRRMTSAAERTIHDSIWMKDISIGYAGDFPEGHAIHRDLSRLNSGDLVVLTLGGFGVEVSNGTGRTVARLSEAGVKSWEHRIPRIIWAREPCMVERRVDEGDLGPAPEDDGGDPESIIGEGTRE